MPLSSDAEEFLVGLYVLFHPRTQALNTLRHTHAHLHTHTHTHLHTHTHTLTHAHNLKRIFNAAS